MSYRFSWGLGLKVWGLEFEGVGAGSIQNG